MKLKIIILNVVAVMLLSALTVKAQDAKSADFSLQAAIDYAIKHNITYLNSELDVKLATYKNKEFIAIGFPQIGASADVKDYFEIPTSLLPGPIFGAPAGTFIPVKFGTQYPMFQANW